MTNPAPSSLSTDIHVSSAQRRIVELLKQEAPCSTARLAKLLDITAAAVRLQLAELESMDLIRQDAEPSSGRGRPAALWTLTEKALTLFPNRHSDLTLELIYSIRETLGEHALEQVLATRDQHQLDELRRITPDDATLHEKSNILANVRSRSGYMAHTTADEQAYLLTENHCPICAAAQSCQQLCKNELQLFRNYFGENTHVERVQHLLSGDARCVYRITEIHKHSEP